MELEEQKQYTEISGRRIVDIAHFFMSLKAVQHDGFGCSLFDIDLVGERRKGFVSVFTVKCAMCNKIETISTENSETSRMNINLSAVSYHRHREVSTTRNLTSTSSDNNSHFSTVSPSMFSRDP
ncbi:hypothetical protein RN001_013659 [Aquatica leii]|uniref:Mutator-like transposase domain-containing protein n=1 Tax=Aquatica leii TaxID=1421715 RepID=A0AAN7P0E1_9COLE|nr:hypothetical protein RN001_013659 [Aquatica leii]